MEIVFASGADDQVSVTCDALIDAAARPIGAPGGPSSVAETSFE